MPADQLGHAAEWLEIPQQQVSAFAVRRLIEVESKRFKPL
jgi:hypothetical protein